MKELLGECLFFCFFDELWDKIGCMLGCVVFFGYLYDVIIIVDNVIYMYDKILIIFGVFEFIIELFIEELKKILLICLNIVLEYK